MKGLRKTGRGLKKIVVKELKNITSGLRNTIKGHWIYRVWEYKGRELIPIFAAMYLTEETVKYLTKHRIYAMVMKDGTMDIVNFELVKKTKNREAVKVDGLVKSH